MTDVRYLKNMDPDQGYTYATVFNTKNLVFAQSANAHGVAAFLPTDAGTYGSGPVFLYSKDDRAEASIADSPSIRNASDPAVAGDPVNTSTVADDSINLLFKVGDLAPGAHTTLTYYYGATDALDLTISKLGSKPTDLTSNNDTQDYSAAGAKVFVDAGAGADSVVGSAFNDILQGGLNADTMAGGDGKDTMDGGQGGDFLTGGAKADVLYGGYGQDRFIYLTTGDSTNSARDTIMDFSHSDGDKIDLSPIDAQTNVGGNNTFTLVAGFTHHSGELIQVATAGGYLVEGDTNGDGMADLVIYVRAQAPLVASDFVL
jgi:Ca2+-binding RTX toxin-like protein